MTGERDIQIMKAELIGSRSSPIARVITYQMKLDGKTSWKTLTFTGKADARFYEWDSEWQALTEHEQAVAYYRETQLMTFPELPPMLKPPSFRILIVTVALWIFILALILYSGMEMGKLLQLCAAAIASAAVCNAIIHYAILRWLWSQQRQLRQLWQELEKGQPVEMETHTEFRRRDPPVLH